MLEKMPEASVTQSPGEKSEESLSPVIQEGINFVNTGNVSALKTYLVEHPGVVENKDFLRAVGLRCFNISRNKIPTVDPPDNLTDDAKEKFRKELTHRQAAIREEANFLTGIIHDTSASVSEGSGEKTE